MERARGALAVRRRLISMDAREMNQMHRQHIFVVNGAPEFLDAVRALLQEERYNVTTTNFVPHTFDQIAALEPDLLIIDLAAGIQAGWELLERLGQEAQTQDIPVIVVSTRPKYLDAVRADPARYGAQRFLAKPFDIDDMLTAVDELIGKA
jgi:CheY-like chemotaxis protein